ncbi:P-loop NTPase family protein [Actinophytocola sediminis]
MDEPGASQRAVAKSGSTVLQAGRDVISGNVFVGRFARLRDVWLDPAPVFDEVDVDHFVGRKWLIDAIEKFMRARDRGYVIVEAPAGLGKTAFAAWLARRHSWPCHFTRRRKGRLSAVALRNLAAQLIARYDLAEQFAPGGMMPETAGEPGWFDHVLRAARAAAPGERIVLVVDGLDEAENVDGDLPLGLPNSLPAGVFLIITCRVGTNLSALRQPWTALSIEAEDRRNTNDLRRYLVATTREPSLAVLLDANGMSADLFARRLAAQCGGVWVYLRYVLDELRLGLRSVSDLDRLPADLVHYYLESLSASSDRAGWTELRLPVLATLAAIAEPVPMAALTGLAGLLDTSAVADLCHGRLRPFLTTTTVGNDVLYGIYHASLREFMTNGPSEHHLDTLRTTTRELATATRRAHGSIANRYLAEFGELANDLPTLSDDLDLAAMDRQYARRHLAFHLEHAGRTDDLHRLLAIEHDTPRHGPRNLWFDVHDQAGQLSEYLDDLRRACRLAAQDTDAQLQAGALATDLGRELHYAVIIATVTALTAHVPVPLLVRMVATGQWTAARGAEHARNLHDPGTRAHALTDLLGLLPPAERPAVAAEALAAARASVDGAERIWLLRRLRPNLGAEDRQHVLAEMHDAADAIPEAAARATALFEVGLDLPEPHQRQVLSHAVTIATGIADTAARAEVLATIARRTPDFLTGQVLDAVATVKDGEVRAYVLVVLAPRLPRYRLPDALAVVRGIEQPDFRSWAIGVLAGTWPAEEHDLVAEAERDARAAEEPGDRAWALCLVADVVDDRQHRATLLESALADAREVDLKTSLRACRLTEIANRLDDVAVREEALNTVRATTHAPTRCRLLHQLATMVDEPQVRDAMLVEVLGEVRQLGNDYVVELLAEMAPTLPATLFPQVLEVVGALSDQYQRGWILGVITEHLPAALVTEAVAAARSVSHEFGRAQLLGEIAARLPQDPGQYAEEALASAEAITSTYFRALACADLAINQPNRREHLFARALAIARTAEGFPRIRLMKRLAVHVEPGVLVELRSEALTAARSMRDPLDRAQALALLIPHLSGQLRAEVMSEAVAATLDMTPEYQRGAMLGLLAGLSTGAQRTSLLNKALTTLEHMPTAGPPIAKFARRAARLARLLPQRLVLGLITRFLEANVDEVARTTATAKAAPIIRRFPEKLIADGIEALHTLPASINITAELAAIAIYLPPSLRDRALTEALTLARETRAARRRALQQAQHVRTTAPEDDLALLRRCVENVELNDCLSILAAAVPTVHELADDRTLHSLVQSIRTVERWWYQRTNTNRLSTVP